MRHTFFLFLFFKFYISFSQTINLNESYLNNYLRASQLLGEFENDISFTLRPLNIGKNGLEINSNIFNSKKYAPTIQHFLNGNGKIKVLPMDYNIEFNSHHPYNMNNGSMIPNRGYQHIISLGIYAKIGIFSIQLKPEYLFSENKDFDGFPESHDPIVWAKRYILWNGADIPERFGTKNHNKILIGQSNIRLNYKGLSVGFSNENIWWGPSIRNSIMMSNNARGFKHITFNTTKPLNTKIGKFEWQFITGRLEKSGYTPPNTDYTYAGNKIYIPKINQNGETDDWRYFQGYCMTYSPKWISGLSLGIIRWTQMYSALVEGKYYWMNGKPTYLPLFSNLFRKNDKYTDYEMQTDQAAGVFFRWLWKDSRAEIYAELHYNDSKVDLRDLIIDSDHARAVTIGIQKIFNYKKDNYLFSWEWTQMGQTGSRLVREAGSWYKHSYVNGGFTNHGEILGSAIGPGSNSHYFALNRIRSKEKIGLALEIIDQDNDFYYSAFESANGLKRNWKDFNFHINFSKKYKKLWLSSNVMYSRSLNYQWELEDVTKSNYHKGRNVNNFHLNLKIAYLFPLAY